VIHLFLLRAFLLLLGLAAWLGAQETTGGVDIGFQQFYLVTGSRRISNVSGLVVGYRQFIPNAGMLTASVAPASSDGRFQTGENFLQLRGLPWKGQHWTLLGGDFRLPGRVLEVSFNNLFYPEIAGRGGWLEATHGGRTIGFFAGTETVPIGLRVPLRLKVPQNLAGAYFRQKVGDRLQLGARYIQFSNDLEELRKSSFLLATGSDFKRAGSATLHSLLTLAGPLKWYGELGWSGVRFNGGAPAIGRSPLSAMAGPVLETMRFTLKANYVHQSSSYLPLLGFSLGDRKGYYGEARFRPFSRLELYGGANEYRNNLDRIAARPTFRTVSESAGASLRLPARFTLNGQVSVIKLWSRSSDADPTERSLNQQLLLNLTRPIRRHALRLTTRDFRQLTRNGFERQRSAEFEDMFQLKRFVFGASVRMQRLIAARESKTSFFYRGLVQVQAGPLSAYANVETGNDLANRTVFALNTVNSTVIGGSLNLGRAWSVQAEAFRNNLITELNPLNVFVLQGQNVFVPGVLANFNQWSLYFRLNRRFDWGKPMPTPDLARFITLQNPLTGAVEGFVVERTPEGDYPIQGIPVSLDQSSTLFTDAQGRFHFSDVPEGTHKVGLAMEELPADFDAGARREYTVTVRPNRVVRLDLDVIQLTVREGFVNGPEGVSRNNIIIRLYPTERYTTADSDGHFRFHNLPRGTYELALDETTLPQDSVVVSPRRVPLTVTSLKESEPVAFQFEIMKPEKVVRKIFEREASPILEPASPKNSPLAPQGDKRP